jgi:pyruvate kinase
MLSGESASGKYPVEAVETMAQIIRDTEESPFDDAVLQYEGMVYNDYDSVINSAHDLAMTSEAKAVVLFSEAGTSARMMAHHRPEQMILVATCNPKTYNQMSIVWGARSYLFDCNNHSREDMIEEVIELNKEAGRLKAGDKVVVILGKIPGRKDVALTGIRIVE